MIARAYIDQLLRSGAMTETRAGEANALLDRVAERLENGQRSKGLATRLARNSEVLMKGSDESLSGIRKARLARTLRGMARQLR